GDDKPVIITGITLDGDWGTNYALNIYYGIPEGDFDPITSTYTAAEYMGVPGDEIPENAIDIVTANISKVVLTPSFTVATRQYNGSTNASVSMTLLGAIEGESPTGTATGRFNNAAAGTNKPVAISTVTLNGGWETNYSIGEYANPTGTITAASTNNDDDDDYSRPDTSSTDSDSSSEDIVDIDDSSIPLAEPDSSVIDIGIPDIPLANNPGMGAEKTASGVVLILTAVAACAIASKSKRK
ncbi:MAG: YDG domain-containing protein, partial [Oscillospiraceae bacterium]